MFLKSNAHTRERTLLNKKIIKRDKDGTERTQVFQDEISQDAKPTTHAEDVELSETLADLRRRVNEVLNEYDHDAINEIAYRQQTKYIQKGRTGKYNELIGPGFYFYVCDMKPAGKELFENIVTSRGGSTKAFLVNMFSQMISAADEIATAFVPIAARLLFAALYRMPGNKLAESFTDRQDMYQETFNILRDVMFDQKGNPTEIGKTEGFGRFDKVLSTLLMYLDEQDTFRPPCFANSYESYPDENYVSASIAAAIEIAKINGSINAPADVEQYLFALVDLFRRSKTHEDRQATSKRLNSSPLVKTLKRLFEPVMSMTQDDEIDEFLKSLNLKKP